jgi:glycosyltransferase involved in cell wall biosynthesis
MTQPSVTVMMPCYNNSKYIFEAIQSVLSQTHRDFELLIIDDASTDDSVQIVQACADPRIRLVRNDNNRGIAAVRNQLLSLATGKYLTSLDGDDIYCSPKKLEKELSLIESTDEAPGPLIVYSDVHLITADGQVISQASRTASPREGLIFQGLLERSIMIPRDFLLSAELARDVGGFDESLPIYEDWDYKLRLARRARFAYTNHVAIGYRRHGAGLSAVSKAKHEQYRGLIKRKYGIHGFERRSTDWVRRIMRKSPLFASNKAA